MGIFPIIAHRASRQGSGTTGGGGTTPEDGGNVARYGTFELSPTITDSIANPYDYDQIRVYAVFTSPASTQKTVDGFYMQGQTMGVDGTLTPSGTPGFKIRFSPNAVGTWSYTVYKSIGGGTASTVSTGTFACVSSTNKGFIKTSSTNYLQYDSGDQFIPIGLNLAWPGEESNYEYISTGWREGNVKTNYTSWLTNAESVGINYVRIWISSYYQYEQGFTMEWLTENGTYPDFQGLKYYSQIRAYYLEWVLEQCKAKGIKVQLCFSSFHDFTSVFGVDHSAGNPYLAHNAYGYSAPGQATGNETYNDTAYFFSTANGAATKAVYKNFVRYVVARYGYNNAVAVWELFNEVDFITEFPTDVDDWHNEMFAFVRQIDPQGRPVTTSSGGVNPDADQSIFRNTTLDFTQIHLYNANANVEATLAEMSKKMLDRYTKPVIVAEFGLNSTGAATEKGDSYNTSLHNTLWSALLGGAMGGSLYWWWDNYIAPLNLWSVYEGIAAFKDLVNFKTDDYAPVVSTPSAGLNSFVLRSAAGGKATGWIHNENYQHQYIGTNGIPAAVTGTVEITDMLNGGYSISYYSTQTGQFLSTQSATATGGVLTLSPGSVAWDVAFIAIKT